MPDIFLSYSRDDLAIARRYAEALQGAGFEVWWDQSLNAGEAYDHVTEHALKTAKAVVVLWSKQSVTSRWVRAEATMADRNKTLVPVMIETCERPIMFELTQTAELMHWRGDTNDAAWQNFVKGLQKFVNKAQVAEFATLAPKTPTTAHPARNVGLKVALAAAALVVVGGVAWSLMRPGTSVEPAPTTAAVTESTTGEEATSVTAAPVAAEKSIAVLPFANLSTEADQEYFADGLADELINKLSGVKDLAVIGRTNAFAYKGSTLQAAEIATALSVNHLLQGSVRKAGNQLRIAVQLTDAAGVSLWSNSFDRTLDDIFAVQDEIAQAVTTALSITLGAGAFAQEGMTRNVEAYDAVLRSRAARLSGTAENLQQAIVEAERAVALDPEFALGWAAVANSYNLAGNMLAISETVGYGAKEDEAMQKIISLAPIDSQVGMLARVRQLAFPQGDFLAAEQLFSRIFELHGESVDATFTYAQFLSYVGRTQEALQYWRRLYRLDPQYNQGMGQGLFAAMIIAAAPEADVLAVFDSVPEAQRSPAFYADLSFLKILQQDWDGALEATSKLQTVRDIQTRLLQLVQAGNRDEALRLLVEERNGPSGATGGRIKHLPWIALALGDDKLALEVQGRILIYSWSPYYSEARRLPEFKQQVKDLGLDAYWRESGHWADACSPVGTDDFECH